MTVQTLHGAGNGLTNCNVVIIAGLELQQHVEGITDDTDVLTCLHG